MLIRAGDVVQVNPSHDWGGAFVSVTEVKPWGIVGFVEVPTKGQAYVRLEHGDFERVGIAPFVLSDFDGEGIGAWIMRVDEN